METEINNPIAMHKCKIVTFHKHSYCKSISEKMWVPLTCCALCWRIQSEFTLKLEIQMHISLVHNGYFNAMHTHSSLSLHNDTWHIQSNLSQCVSNGIVDDDLNMLVPLKPAQWKINNWQMCTHWECIEPAETSVSLVIGPTQYYIWEQFLFVASPLLAERHFIELQFIPLECYTITKFI